MNLKISSSNYEVLKSGTIINFEKESSINLKCNFEEINFNFEVEFRFINTESKKIEAEKKVESNSKIVIECRNYGNQLGIGTLNAIELATVENKKMYMNYMINHLIDTQRILFYTFYIEE